MSPLEAIVWAIIASILAYWLVRLARPFLGTRSRGDRAGIGARLMRSLLSRFSPEPPTPSPQPIGDTGEVAAQRVEAPGAAGPSRPEPAAQGLALSQSRTARGVALTLGAVLVALGQYRILDSRVPPHPSSLALWLNTALRFDVPSLDNVLLGLPLLALGGAVLLWAIRDLPLFDSEANPGDLLPGALPFDRLRGMALPAAIAGGTLVLLLVRLAGLDSRAYLPLLWLAIVAAFAVFAWTWDRRCGISLSPNLTRRDGVALALLVLFGLALGAFRLEAMPGQLMGDEGNFWTTARDIARGAYRPPVFDFGVYSYAILSSIYQAEVLRLFGITLWAWRFASLLAGVLGVVPLYLLARELFDRRVAAVSAVVMVASPYFLAFSRMGYNNSQVLLPVTLALYAAYLGIKRSSAFYFYLAGCAAAAGFYTYTAGRSALVIVAAFVWLEGLRRGRLPAATRAALVFGLGVFVVAAPHLVYGWAQDPAAGRIKFLESVFFNADFAGEFFGQEEIFSTAPALAVDRARLFFQPRIYGMLLARGLARTLLAFQKPGLVTEHFIAAPLAGTVGAAFYLVGLTVVLAGLRQRRHRLLATWLAVTIVAFSAANTFPPRHQHMVGIIPLVGLMIGAAIIALADAVCGLIPRSPRRVGWAVIGAIVVAVAWSGAYDYFVRVPRAYWPNLEQIISWFALPSQGERFTFVYSEPAGKDFVPYVTREIRPEVAYRAVALQDLQAGRVPFAPDERSLVFFPPDLAQPVSAALRAAWGEIGASSVFLNREGLPIGGAISRRPFDFHPSASLTDSLITSYRRPIVWPLLVLAALAALLSVGKRSWIATWPAWARAGLEWFFAPPMPLPVEVGPSRGRARSSLSGKVFGNLRLRRQTSEAARVAPTESQTELPPAAAVPPQSAMPSASEMPASAPPSPPAAADTVRERPLFEIEFKARVNWPGGRAGAPIALRALVRRPKVGGQAGDRHLPIFARLASLLAIPASLADRYRHVVGKHPKVAGGMAAASLLTALAGQYQFIFRDDLRLGLGLSAAAVVCFVAVIPVLRVSTPAGRSGDEESPQGPIGWRVPEPRIRWTLITASIVLAVVNLVVLDGLDRTESQWSNLAVWIVSMSAFAAAFLPAGLTLGRSTAGSHRPFWAALAVIVVLAYGLRFYRLGGIPGIMENDEASVGRLAQAALSGELRALFQTYLASGTLHFLLMSIPVKLFGATRFALRVPTAIAGWLAVPTVGLLALRLFGRRVALIAAALTAFSHFLIHFSRVSPAASSFDPLLSAAAFLLLYEAGQRRRPILWALAGIAMGILLNVYVGARIIPVIAVAYLAALVVAGHARRRTHWRAWATLGAGFLLSAAPMLLWAVRQPDAFNARINQVGIVPTGWLANEMATKGLSLWQVLGRQLADSLLMFNFHPARWFYNADVPMLGPLTAALLALGLVYGLARLRDPRFLLLNLWFWITLFAGQVMMVDPPANAYRTLALAPAAILLAAVVLDRLAAAVIAPHGRARQLALALVAVALAGEATWNVWYYFGEWAPKNQYSDANTRLASLIADYLSADGPERTAYVFGAPRFRAQGWAAIEYLAGDVPVVDVEGALPEALPALPPGQAATFIFTPERADELQFIERAYPGGRRLERYLGESLYFMAYEFSAPSGAAAPADPISRPSRLSPTTCSQGRRHFPT